MAMSSRRIELLKKLVADLAEPDYSDIPEVDTDAFWANAMRFQDHLAIRRKKQTITTRIDCDVVDWLKAKGEGYQTRINALLREAMQRDRHSAR
jgi:uncharacterized protein (DUF4415 family)